VSESVIKFLSTGVVFIPTLIFSKWSI